MWGGNKRIKKFAVQVTFISNKIFYDTQLQVILKLGSDILTFFIFFKEMKISYKVQVYYKIRNPKGDYLRMYLLVPTLCFTTCLIKPDCVYTLEVRRNNYLPGAGALAGSSSSSLLSSEESSLASAFPLVTGLPLVIGLALSSSSSSLSDSSELDSAFLAKKNNSLFLYVFQKKYDVKSTTY